MNCPLCQKECHSLRNMELSEVILIQYCNSNLLDHEFYYNTDNNEWFFKYKINKDPDITIILNQYGVVYGNAKTNTIKAIQHFKQPPEFNQAVSILKRISKNLIFL